MKMKKIIVMSMVLFAVMILGSCKKEQDLKTYVLLEMNPGVELVLDKNDKVLAANGVNNEGKSLIYSQELVGKKINEALELFVEEATKMGYLFSVNANITKTERELSVAIYSTASNKQVSLDVEIKATVENLFTQNNLNASYIKSKEDVKNRLTEMVCKFHPNLSLADSQKLTNEELMSLIELAVLERCELASVELEEMYYSFKESEFKIKYKEVIAEQLSKSSVLVAAAYQLNIELLKTASNMLNDFKYSIYASEESIYLNLLNRLEKLKDENIILSLQLSVNSSNYDVEAKLIANQEIIDNLQKELQSIVTNLDSKIDEILSAIESAITELEKLEKNISTIDYEAALEEVEKKVNANKDSFLSNFEAKYATVIQKAKEALANRKQELIESTAKILNK